MIANHIHDALEQVRRMQELVHEKRHFHGYSGLARLFSGTVACIAAMALCATDIPHTPTMHLAVWGVVLGISLVANYGGLAYWFCTDRDVRRNPIMLKPALDAVPALGAGAIVSLALIMHGAYDLLMGCWMIFYGLAQMAYRLSLPKGIYLGGIWYIAWGTLCLLMPNIEFTNPWPMGVAFLIGESYGGHTLCQLKKETSA
jgi:hypothetical protein